MSGDVTYEGWTEPPERLHAAIAEAMKTARRWDEGCAAAARSLGAPEAHIADEPWEDYGRDTTLFRWITVHIAGSSWGLWVREIGDHAFLMSDWEEPYQQMVWGWWTPPDDRTALEAAVEAAWLEHRWDVPLPPAVWMNGVIWEGPEEGYELAFRCMDRLLVEVDEAWGEFVEQLPEMVASIEALIGGDGSLEALMRGSTPLPLRDLEWLKRVVAGGDIDATRDADDERRSLISYYLMA